MKRLCFFLLFALFLLQNKLSATSVIPFRHLGEAAQTSEAVVLASAETRYESTSGDLVFYDCRLRVKDLAKGGFAPGETFALRQYAHRWQDFEGTVAGDFVPEEGKTYLLFLRRSGDVWRPVTLSYYVFETKKIGDEEFLVPLEEGFGIALAPRPDGVQPEPLGVYRAGELLQQLRQYAGGTTEVWNPTPALTGLAPGDFPTERVLPSGCDFALGASLARWVDAAVEVYYDDTGVPTGFSGILDDVLGDMNTNYTGIDPTNNGLTSFTPDCFDMTIAGSDLTTFLTSLNGDQTTLIMFEDPCGQIPDLSSCMGTLAIGGGYSSSSTHVYKGDTWHNAKWGYVAVNNGTFTCLSTTDYEIMLTHELTHTYRMDHIPTALFTGQNMNPLCCNPIASQDIVCMNYTYDIAAPVRLTVFDVRLHQRRQVRVFWETASEVDNDHFVLERSADGLRFETMKTVPGNNSLSLKRYEWIDPLPFPGLNYYRLSQIDFDGRANSLGVRVVEVGYTDGVLSIFPNPANGATMTVLLDLPAAFDGFLEITDVNGKILAAQHLVLDGGRNKVEQPTGELPAGVYWLRVQEANGARVLKFLKN